MGGRRVWCYIGVRLLTREELAGRDVDLPAAGGAPARATRDARATTHCTRGELKRESTDTSGSDGQPVHPVHTVHGDFEEGPACDPV